MRRFIVEVVVHEEDYIGGAEAAEADLRWRAVSLGEDADIVVRAEDEFDIVAFQGRARAAFKLAELARIADLRQADLAAGEDRP